MTPFTCSLLFRYVVSCLVSVTIGTYYPDVTYVDDYCDLIFPVNLDVRIKLAETVTLAPNTMCSTILVPANGTRLIAKFLAYSMPTDYINEFGDCPVESIQLFNANGQSAITSGEDYCRAARPPKQYDLGIHGEIRYTTIGAPNIYTADVELLVTEVFNNNDNSCPGGFFDCLNNYCVSEEVTCNGYDDCGNNRDEDSCELAPGTIAGIVIGVIIFVAIIIIAALIIRRNSKRVLYVQQY